MAKARKRKTVAVFHMTVAHLAQLDSAHPDRVLLRRLVRHFLAGCTKCRARFGVELFCRFERMSEAMIPSPVQPIDYDAAIDAALEGALYWKNREPVPAEPADALPLRDTPSRSSRVLILLDQSFAERYRNPRSMLLLALLAQAGADDLDPADLGPRATADLRADAWGELGNAYRLNEGFRAALHAFDRATGLLAIGSGDPGVGARIAGLYASYLSSTRCWDDACEILGDVERVYRRIGDQHLAGRTLISRAIYERYRGNPVVACDLFELGIQAIDSDRDPDLALAARQSLIATLVDCGEFRRCQRLLFESGLRRAGAELPLFLLKVDWVEAATLAGLGKRERAEEVFRETRRRFLAAGQLFDAALVGIDLVDFYLQDGRQAAAAALRREILESLRPQSAAPKSHQGPQRLL
ncbi:MAG: hypothetical protein ABJC13_23860 [Acidobacteriota bacterium]